MKSFCKAILLLLLILNFSCVKEESEIVPETIEQALPKSTAVSQKITSITLSDLQREIGHTKNYQELADKFDVSITSKKDDSKNSGVIMDTGHINRMETNGDVSYTLRVQNQKEVQNVIIEPQGDSLEVKLYTYELLDQLELDDDYIGLGNVKVEP